MQTEFIILFILITNLILISYNKKLSNIYKIYDVPNKRKIHKSNTPLVGGLYFLINILIYFLFITLFSSNNFLYIDNFYDLNKIYLNLIFVLFIFILGYFDDKRDLNPNFKLFILFLIIFFYLFFNNDIVINKLSFSFIEKDIHLGKYSIIFTTFCFLLFINACNMFDGINLQTGIFFSLFAIYLIFISQPFLILIVILFSLIGFLVLNFKGKIFMGDSGVYLYSFILSIIAISFYNQKLIVYADSIFLLMMVPGIDMLRLFIIRIKNKSNPFKPDNNHIHHLLLKEIKYKKTIIILILMMLMPILFLILKTNNIIILISYLVLYFFVIIKFSKKNIF